MTNESKRSSKVYLHLKSFCWDGKETYVNFWYCILKKKKEREERVNSTGTYYGTPCSVPTVNVLHDLFYLHNTEVLKGFVTYDRECTQDRTLTYSHTD